jgi:hypothetical protein
VIRAALIRRAATGALALALLAPASPASALAGGTETQVRFAKGRSSASYKGTLPVGTAEYDAYVLRARAGQSLSVRLTSDDAAAYVIVFAMDLGPAEDRMTPEEPIRDWSGKLPVSGGYSVQVYTEGEGGAAYTLEIGVT